MSTILIVIIVTAIAVAALVIMKKLNTAKMYQDVMWSIIAICLVSNLVLNVRYLDRYRFITARVPAQDSREMGTLRDR